MDVKALYKKFHLLTSTTSYPLGVLLQQRPVQQSSKEKMLYSVNLKRLEEVERIYNRLLEEKQGIAS